MSTRDIGDEFEKKVARLLDLQTTAKSGGHWDNADLTARPGHALHRFTVECKYKSVPWLRPVKSEVQKVMRQADKIGNDWMYIQSNDAGDFVVMSLDALAELIEEIKFKK